LFSDVISSRYWNAELAKFDPVARFFRMLKKFVSFQHLLKQLLICILQNVNYVVRDDLRIIVQGKIKIRNFSSIPNLLISEIVNRHPGLEFLEETPEFQLKYGEEIYLFDHFLFHFVILFMF